MNIKFNINSELSKKLTIEQLKEVLFRSMIKMQELATINCPFDTGRLSESIHLSPTTPGYNNYILYDNVEYAVHVEFGTIKMIAQPFFRIAFDQVKQIWVKRYFNQVLGKGK